MGLVVSILVDLAQQNVDGDAVFVYNLNTLPTR